MISLDPMSCSDDGQRSGNPTPESSALAPHLAEKAALVQEHLTALRTACAEFQAEGIDCAGLFETAGFGASVRRVIGAAESWRMRVGSNMSLIADQLESAGDKGLSEAELVCALQAAGRLRAATDPRRAVHWSVSELARRTGAVIRASRASGGRWYAIGPFDRWRAPHTDVREPECKA